MRMTKPIVTMAATLAACISTAEAAVGSSDWFFVDTTEKRQDYVLKFDANLGTGTIEDMPLSYGEQISLPDPKNKITRDGYAFVGWSTNLNVNIFNHLDIDKMEFDYDAMGVYRPGDTWCLDEDSIRPESVTLYAIWIEDVTIHFDVNGGEGAVDLKKVPFGERVSLPVPGRRGRNIFLGWARWRTVDLQLAVRTGKDLSEVEGFYPTNSPPRKFLGYVVTYDQPSSEQKNYHYEPGLTLFAIWTTTLTYSFYNEKLYDPTLGYSIPRLNPQELADHLHWSYHSGLDEDNADWVWSRCAHGKSAEVYPGSHVIKLESDPGYEWLAELSKTVDMDSDGEVWSVTESSVWINLTVDSCTTKMSESHRVGAKGSPKMGYVWFQCKAGNMPPFDLSKVKVYLTKKDGDAFPSHQFRETIVGAGGRDAWISTDSSNGEWLLCPKGKYKMVVHYLDYENQSYWSPKRWEVDDITVSCSPFNSAKARKEIEFVVRQRQTNMTQQWLDDHPATSAASGGDIATAAVMPAANGCRTVGECYALGIDPEDPNDDLRITAFKEEGGQPVITVNHTTDGSGNSFANRIRTLGKKTLMDAEWVDVTDITNRSEYRFFKVSVVVP